MTPEIVHDLLLVLLGVGLGFIILGVLGSAYERGRSDRS